MEKTLGGQSNQTEQASQAFDWQAFSLQTSID
jgi:hypothetical protein